MGIFIQNVRRGTQATIGSFFSAGQKRSIDATDDDDDCVLVTDPPVQSPKKKKTKPFVVVIPAVSHMTVVSGKGKRMKYSEVDKKWCLNMYELFGDILSALTSINERPGFDRVNKSMLSNKWKNVAQTGFSNRNCAGRKVSEEFEKEVIAECILF